MKSVNLKMIITALTKIEPGWQLGSVQVNYPSPDRFSIFFTDEQGRFRQRIIDSSTGKTWDKVLLLKS